MKLHGKLLICARNESVELDRLMNIHPGLRHAGADQWLEQPTRLMTQIWASYPGGETCHSSPSVSRARDGADNS